MPKAAQVRTSSRPEFRPFDDAAIYKLDEATAERMALSFLTLQNYVYRGEITYIQYPKGRRLRGCDLNDWIAARVQTPEAEALRVRDPVAVARGQASARVREANARVREARRAAKTRRAATRSASKA